MMIENNREMTNQGWFKLCQGFTIIVAVISAVMLGVGLVLLIYGIKFINDDQKIGGIISSIIGGLIILVDLIITIWWIIKYCQCYRKAQDAPNERERGTLV